jgi:hypothetical protein
LQTRKGWLNDQTRKSARISPKLQEISAANKKPHASFDVEREKKSHAKDNANYA